MSIQKTEIQIDVNGKTVNAYLASPPDGPGVLVLPSWWGLKPFFKQICDQLAEQGYTALAPDYYKGRIGTTIEETQTLQQEAEGDFEAMRAMIKAVKDHLVSLQPGKPIGIVGFSMGTDWAVITAASEIGCRCDRFILWRLEHGFQQDEIESAGSLCRNR